MSGTSQSARMKHNRLLLEPFTDEQGLLSEEVHRAQCEGIVFGLQTPAHTAVVS